MDIPIYIFAHYVCVLIITFIACSTAFGSEIAKTCRVPTERYTDKNFPASSMLYGRLVTCAENNTTKSYAGETWTCKDMRIDGKRLAYRHIHGFSADRICSPEETVEGYNDISSLCSEFVKQQSGSMHGHLTVLISEANCVKIGASRVIFEPTADSFQWRDVEKEHGFVISLQCMLVPCV